VLNFGGVVGDMGQSLKLDGSSVYMAGFFGGNNVNFNPIGTPNLLSTSFVDFFIAKYSTSSLSCIWAKKYDLQVNFPDFEINALQIVSGRIVAAGNFKGSGDFTTCGAATVFNATTLDGFMVGYNVTDPAITVSGPTAICSPGQMIFTAQNIPIGATVAWSVSPAGSVSPATGSGTTFVTNLLPGYSQGQLFVSATISGSCGTVVIKTIELGPPEVTCAPDIVLEPCNTLHATACSGANIYNWYIDGNLVLTSSFHEVYISLVINQLGAGQHSLCVATQNDCGEAPQVCTVFVTGDCGSGQNFAMAYPNPAQGSLNLTIEEGGKQELDYEYTYKLIDKNGLVVSAGTTNKNSIMLDVSVLAKDTYYFKLWLPKQLVEQRIVIN